MGVIRVIRLRVVSQNSTNFASIGDGFNDAARKLSSGAIGEGAVCLPDSRAIVQLT